GTPFFQFYPFIYNFQTFYYILVGFPFNYFRSLTEANLKARLSYFNRYNERAYYRELPMVGKRRYILCFNPEKFLEERKNREAKLRSIEEYFLKLNQALSKAMNSRDRKKVEARVYYYLKRRKALRYFRYEVREVRQRFSRQGKVREVLTYQLDFERDLARLEQESLLDGVYVLASNLVVRNGVGEIIVSALDLVSAYRWRIIIEQTFHHLKSFVDIRPIYHRLDERVCAHVLICVLGYLLNRTVEYLLRLG
ncbi:MAG: IS1634 family transposase, partial [bacterium]